MMYKKYFDNECSSHSSCGASTPTPPANSSSAPTPIELHACMGLNACKGHDRFGTNECAGMGYCATTTHVCHALNNCRCQGGCGLYGSAEEQEIPGMNNCAMQGSCATPIQQGRFSTQGSNQGKSVWLLARKLFEDRLTKEGRGVGNPPFKEGPPTWWLNSLGPYDACGSSGNMNCTFGLKQGKCGLCGNNAEKENNLCKTAGAPGDANKCNASGNT